MRRRETATDRSAPLLARSLARLMQLDERTLALVLDTRSDGADRLMQAASTAANRSRLWLGTAALLAIVGGPAGRRAAVTGAASVAISSAVVNGPVKFVSRRDRPAAELIGKRPRLVEMPRTYSFPSGHSASAFAFATAVSREFPRAGPFVGAAAATVAYSRMYTGVHFPGDVLAGAAIGTACATPAQRLVGWLASKRLIRAG